jgi:hypothetical protein
MEVIKNNAKLSIVSPQIQPNISGTDVGAAEAKHNMNMLNPKLPNTIVSLAQSGNFPSSSLNLLVADAYVLQAPEVLLTKLRELPGDELTTRKVFAYLEEMWLDTEVCIPSVYRNSPEVIKLKTQIEFLALILLNRNVGDDSSPNERTMQWLKKSIQAVQQSFEEIARRPAPAPQSSGKWIKNPFKK